MKITNRYSSWLTLYLASVWTNMSRQGVRIERLRNPFAENCSSKLSKAFHIFIRKESLIEISSLIIFWLKRKQKWSKSSILVLHVLRETEKVRGSCIRYFVERHHICALSWSKSKITMLKKSMCGRLGFCYMLCLPVYFLSKAIMKMSSIWK